MDGQRGKETTRWYGKKKKEEEEEEEVGGEEEEEEEEEEEGEGEEGEEATRSRTPHSCSTLCAQSVNAGTVNGCAKP